jgi:hypothetical protein
VRVVFFKVDDSWEVFEAVHLDEVPVLRLHHPDSDGIGVVVNVLKVFQSFVTSFAIRSIYI